MRATPSITQPPVEAWPLLIRGLRLEAQRLPSSPSALGDFVIGSIQTNRLNIKKSQAVSLQTEDFMISRLQGLNHQCPQSPNHTFRYAVEGAPRPSPSRSRHRLNPPSPLCGLNSLRQGAIIALPFLVSGGNPSKSFRIMPRPHRTGRLLFRRRDVQDNLRSGR